VAYMLFCMMAAKLCSYSRPTKTAKSPSTLGLEVGLQALNPSSQIFADIGIVSPFAEAYGAEVYDLYYERHQAKRNYV